MDVMTNDKRCIIRSSEYMTALYDRGGGGCAKQTEPTLNTIIC